MTPNDLPDAERLNPATETWELYKTVLKLDKQIGAAKLDPLIRELVKIRASQINGCAYCIELHTREAREVGETDQRMHGLSAWREAPYYTDDERAALELCEEMTRLGSDGVSDAVYDEALARLGAEELGTLIWQVVAINVWNRIAITSQMVPGT
jgi:AhpD family alkylhydroperoxidase